MLFPFLIFGLSTAASVVLGAVSTLFGFAGGGAALAYGRSEAAEHRRVARSGQRTLRREARRQRRLLERLRGRIRSAVVRTHSAQNERLTRSASVEVLKSRLAARIRWSALEDAGIATVADLRALSRKQLIDLPGIGEKSADELLRAATDWRRALDQGPPRAPDPDLPDRYSVEVARRALALQAARAELGSVPAELEATIDRLDRRTAEARRAGGFWTWLFGSRGKKWARAVELSRQVRAETEKALPQVERARQVLENSRRSIRERVRKSEVRRRYRVDFAALASEIEASSADVAVQPATAPVAELDDSTIETIEKTTLAGEGIKVGLRRYQQFGAKFILAQERTILGDEMGLGKTIQTLAAMAQLYNERTRALFVVVAPASILINWEREFRDKTFLDVAVAHGREKKNQVRDWLHNAGALVISYATLRSFPIHEELDAVGRKIDMLVADEAHFVKNPEAARSQAVGALVERSDHIVFLTGTPMENHPREFAELIRRLDPRVKIPVSREGFDTPHARSTARKFREDVAPIYLRRNQVDVLLELPDRLELEEWVTLTREQADAYRDAVCTASFMKMRQVVTLTPDDRSAIPGSTGALSSKLRRLDELLDEHIDEGRKVLIFSYFLDVLAEVEARYETIGCIAGGVSSEQRFEWIDEFSSREGHALLIAQITAAGQGLNLQAASVVILLEPQLTPTIEAQAIARAHRMGQVQRVIVHRLLAADTVDQRLVEVLAEKESLFDAYARESVAKEENPEAVETHVVKRILELEKRRLSTQD